MAYDHLEIEARWQRYWDEHGTFRATRRSGRPKRYVLDMFPYPSGVGLHVGHPEGYTATDIMARAWRMRGYDVLHPMGWDAFGLPAEQHAIETGQHPAGTTANNIATFKRQLKMLGFSYDWSREIDTTDPGYVRWTQWIFLQLFRRGLAYQATVPVNWCPALGTVLANEEVVDGKSERGGHPVYRTPLRQWMLKITAYADRLAEDLALVDWPEGTLTAQRRWIGRSEGAEIVFTVAPDDHQPGGDEVRVFTTRPDTLFGATFMVLAPEHPLVARLTAPDRKAAVDSYVYQTRRETEIERLSTEREKTGVPIGADAINPVNGERVPIWIADYVLASYGTGAIMAVPAHDERDFEFARKFGLPIRRVVAAPGTPDDAPMDDAYAAHTEGEILVNSGRFSGTSADEGGRKIVEWLASQDKARPTVTYRVRDWLISRQRPWGTPIPVIYCDRDGIVPVPEEQLPVLLPDDFVYGAKGENPLLNHPEFLNVTCPRCGEPARRETDTMDTFVDSSWYWYRYLSPHTNDAPIDKPLVERWCPVDQCTGGAEHAVMHLLYSRFFTKAMRDIGLIHEDEPFRRLFNQGQILGSDGERMSKSRGNVQDPDALVGRYGADTIRLFLMFMGPWDQGGPWSPTGIGGVFRFLNRVWTLALDPHGQEPGDPASGQLPEGEDESSARRAIRATAHRTLKVVSGDYTGFRFNTMVAHLMELANTLFRYRGTVVAGDPEWDEAIRLMLLMLAPAAPHITEELWSRRLAEAGEDWSSIHSEEWPMVDETAAAADTREVPVQVNGKLRDRVVVPAGIGEIELEQVILARDRIHAALGGREPDRVIHASGGRLVNIVVR